MKTLTFFLAIILATVLTNMAKASDADSTKVVKVITKTIKIDDDGKVITKTMVNGKEFDDENLPDSIMKKHCVMVFDGDDSPNHKSMKWVGDEDNFDITVETDGDSSKVFVFKTPNGMKRWKMKMPPMMDDEDVFFGHDMDNFPMPPMPHMMTSSKDVIDLNDPNIVSFQRETTKDGNEKITIIRKAPKKD